MKLLHLTLFRICDFGFAKQLRADNGMLMTPCYTGYLSLGEDQMMMDHIYVLFSKLWIYFYCFFF